MRFADTDIQFMESTELVDSCPVCGEGNGHGVYKIQPGGRGPKTIRESTSLARNGDLLFSWVCVAESGVAYYHRGENDYEDVVVENP